MSKVLIVGDTHGDATFVANINNEAKRFGVDTVVQLGDFGYNFDKNVVASIAAWLARDESHRWIWLDGNHDHHDFLKEVVVPSGDRSALINMGGLEWGTRMTFPDRMFYAPRGSVAQIGNKTCMFLGGAFSIDRNQRKLGQSWWLDETIGFADVDRAIVNGTLNDVDVMFCHDTPPTLFIESKLQAAGYKSDGDSAENRRRLGLAVSSVRPKDLYHGHYHWRYNVPYISQDGWQVDIHGVGANVGPRGWMDPEARYGENFLIEEW